MDLDINKTIICLGISIWSASNISNYHSKLCKNLMITWPLVVESVCRYSNVQKSICEINAYEWLIHWPEHIWWAPISKICHVHRIHLHRQHNLIGMKKSTCNYKLIVHVGHNSPILHSVGEFECEIAFHDAKRQSVDIWACVWIYIYM